VAKRHAAIHATGPLGAKFLFGVMIVNFLPVANASHWIAVSGQLAIEFKKAGWFSHVSAE
jgi:hypothetical protein